ncbi:hypothetical protein KUTeg_000325, partial [Tegillarca granosa]
TKYNFVFLFLDIQKAFAFFDKDENGKISATEIGIVMKSLGQNPSEKELNDIVREVDKNGDGEIDFDEFFNMMLRKYQQKESGDEVIRRAFKVFDRDGDGQITMSELKSVLSHIGEKITDKDCEKLMKEADINGDGVINYDGRYD